MVAEEACRIVHYAIICSLWGVVDAGGGGGGDGATS